ncbi:D-alanine--D-alanyl carrier protein ligase [Seminavis robusta]|uniref:D-alanine--D-alanyl carrier protein ligase n=1 Tax=Seminavis robusta TaxID=568900 RepID=A0A9N8HBA7_9STRA|nr:D-alanine--D-alanyl carrier protein ligase [Seminavis robusta]|eukprot:Sro329_g118800.1 D-alanine--D-alanyl carrier protein ligase (1758) ;mRNA; r:27754-33267
MKYFRTIVEALNHHALESPEKIVFTWVDIKCKEQNKITFKQLEDQSNAVAARLLKLGCKKGDRVMIAYPFGLEFLAGMFGAMKIGVIPCSIYPPNPNQLKTDMPKFRRLAEDAGAKYALSTSAFATAMTAASILYKTGVTWIGTDKLFIKKSNTNKPKQYERFVGEPGGICFIQYTSGSTGRPKGVMISHNNLVEDIWAISRVLGTNAVGALWLPQYHDMGLVSGFMSAIYAGVHVIMASPIDFIMRPLLWTDMVEIYQATHTSAPNFAYALLLKRLKQANRKANWSHVTHAMFAAEPTQRHVVEELAQTLSIRREHVYNLYGLAEAVVFLTGGPAYPDTSGVVCCGPADSPSVKLRIVQDGKEIEEGQVGTIWVQSPVCSDTGDLGRVVDGQLYVTGRSKDLIIINGKNHYPTDVELSIDETFGDVIRPGRTSAFQHGDASVGITVEGRKVYKSEMKTWLFKLPTMYPRSRLFASEVVVLKLGVTPKTTSGKLKRSEIRLTTIAGDWKESSILLQFKRQESLTPLQKSQRPSFLERSFSMRGFGSNEFYLNEETEHEIMKQSMSTANWMFEELPDIDLHQTNTLPSKAVEAVHAVECNPNKLEEYFSELHLSGVSGIYEAWSKATKTTAAMQAMCSQILKHLEDKHPTICQLAKTLSENPDWILIDNRTDFLLQLVHQIFVLQWVTTFMMDNAECMQQKLHNDAEWDAMSKNRLPVPLELQEMLDLPEQDPLYGNLPFFGWIKNRSAGALLRLMQKCSESPEGPTVESQHERMNKLLCLNLLEAVWLEQSNGLKANSEVGRLLASYPWLTSRTQSMMPFLEPPSSTWNDLYIAWNMHFVSWSGDKDSSTWMASKLLLPCIIGDVNAGFLHARATSLYLVVQTIGRKTMSPKYYTESVLSRNALEDFGLLNLSWAQKLGYTHPALRNDKIMALNEEDWFPQFDQWGREYLETQAINPNSDIKASIASAIATDPNDFSIRYANVIKSVLGSEVDTSKTWAENGLTSLKSAELRNMVEEQLHVVLPTNFEHLYPTLSELSVFLKASESKRFPKQDTDDHPDFLWNSEISKLSKLQLGAFQTLGSIVILFSIMSSLVPSGFLVSWVMDKCGSSQVGGCNGPILWVLLPMAFPLFLLSLSVIVVLFKFAVVGRYQPRQIDLLSWDYLQWWFIDRLMEVWESIAGKFLKETKYIWLFYRLLGADLAWTAKINSYIREFDLVRVECSATIGYPIKCRKFSQSEESNPKITFRPIVVGKHSKVSGMISPGVKIGEGSKVEKLSVVEEGALVPAHVLAKGNPACNAGSFEHQETSSFEESMLDVFKIAWTILEAYHFFALSYLVHMILNKLLPAWRYATILHWFLLVPATSFLAVLTSIPLKWFLIGKRNASDGYGGSLWKQASNWACDFHFQTASWTLIPFIGQSKVWHLILFLHGLDVDMISTLSHPYTIFFPSKVDFVKIRASFFPTSTLDLSTKADSKIEIIDSSIGYNSNLHAGVKIIKSKIPPRSNVSDSVYNLNHSDNSEKLSSSNLLLPELGQQLLNVVLFFSIVPAYEIGLAATKASSLGIGAFGLAVAFTLQLFVWILLTQAVEKILLSLPHAAQQIFFGIYINHVRQFQAANWLVMVLCGTPMFAYFARFLGAEVDGDLWYFGNSLYEYGKLHFQGCTIVDSAHVAGHYFDGNGLTIDDTYVSGLLHPGCYASAGARVSAAEHGPWKLFLRNDMGAQDSKCSLSDVESAEGSTGNLIETQHGDSIHQIPPEFEV